MSSPQWEKYSENYKRFVRKSADDNSALPRFSDGQPDAEESTLAKQDVEPVAKNIFESEHVKSDDSLNGVDYYVADSSLMVVDSSKRSMDPMEARVLELEARAKESERLRIQAEKKSKEDERLRIQETHLRIQAENKLKEEEHRRTQAENNWKEADRRRIQAEKKSREEVRRRIAAERKDMQSQAGQTDHRMIKAAPRAVLEERLLPHPSPLWRDSSGATQSTAVSSAWQSPTECRRYTRRWRNEELALFLAETDYLTVEDVNGVKGESLVKRVLTRINELKSSEVRFLLFRDAKMNMKWENLFETEVGSMYMRNVGMVVEEILREEWTQGSTVSVSSRCEFRSAVPVECSRDVIGNTTTDSVYHLYFTSEHKSEGECSETKDEGSGIVLVEFKRDEAMPRTRVKLDASSVKSFQDFVRAELEPSDVGDALAFAKRWYYYVLEHDLFAYAKLNGLQASADSHNPVAQCATYTLLHRLPCIVLSSMTRNSFMRTTTSVDAGNTGEWEMQVSNFFSVEDKFPLILPELHVQKARIKKRPQSSTAFWSSTGAEALALQRIAFGLLTDALLAQEAEDTKQFLQHMADYFALTKTASKRQSSSSSAAAPMADSEALTALRNHPDFDEVNGVMKWTMLETTVRFVVATCKLPGLEMPHSVYEHFVAVHLLREKTKESDAPPSSSAAASSTAAKDAVGPSGFDASSGTKRTGMGECALEPAEEIERDDGRDEATRNRKKFAANFGRELLYRRRPSPLEEEEPEAFPVGYIDVFRPPPDRPLSSENATLLGRGRVGSVYLAHLNGVRCAVKTLCRTAARDKDASSPSQIDRELRREEKAYVEHLSDLQGDLIPRFLRRGRMLHDCLTLFITEYAGPALAEDHVFSDEERVRVRRIYDAIHRRGVLHGDVKPANLARIDDEDGNIVLLDFGLATFRNELEESPRDWEAACESESRRVEEMLGAS